MTYKDSGGDTVTCKPDATGSHKSVTCESKVIARGDECYIMPQCSSQSDKDDGVCMAVDCKAYTVLNKTVKCKPQTGTWPYSDQCDAALGGYCNSTDPDVEGECFLVQKIPYVYNGEEVKCTGTNKYGSSQECQQSLGGRCSGINGADGVCYPNPTDFTLFMKNYKVWSDGETRDRCLAHVPEFKRWCEMPWTRPGDNTDYDKKVLGEQIEKWWRQKWRPPFYYNPDDAQCYVTKTYCENSPNTGGGFEANFGMSHDYIGEFIQGCTHPHGKDDAVREGYDCCADLGSSVAQFFFGRTMTADLKDVLSGNISVKTFFESSNPARALGDYLSDERLKTDIVSVAPVWKGVNLYEFTWTLEAERLYGKTGRQRGFLAQELEKVFPPSVARDANGYAFIQGPYVNDCALGEALQYLYATPPNIYPLN